MLPQLARAALIGSAGFFAFQGVLYARCGKPIGSEPQRLDDRLFQTGTTHIEVKCWACGQGVTLRPPDLPDGITDYEFEKRATCRCGTGWPYVTKFPKKPLMTM